MSPSATAAADTAVENALPLLARQLRLGKLLLGAPQTTVAPSVRPPSTPPPAAPSLPDDAPNALVGQAALHAVETVRRLTHPCAAALCVGCVFGVRDRVRLAGSPCRGR